MSRSQFYSTSLLILRHAWLNLLDKHMTTGRINQVTTLRLTPAGTCTRQPPPGTNLQNDLACFDTEGGQITITVT